MLCVERVLNMKLQYLGFLDDVITSYLFPNTTRIEAFRCHYTFNTLTFREPIYKISIKAFLIQ